MAFPSEKKPTCCRQSNARDSLPVIAARWTSPHDVGLIKSDDGPGLLCDVNTVFMHGDVKDIAQSEALVERYGTRIPVLRRNDTGAELDWPFTRDQLLTFLQ